MDRGDQLGVTAFGTQKLCVILRSIEAILRARRGHRHHLALLPRQHAGSEHDLAEELVHNTNEMRAQHANLDARVQEQAQIRAQFAADIARFQELTAQSAK